MKNNEYRFAVSLCGGWTGGHILIKAKDEEEAYGKAMDFVYKKLNTAFPTLEVDYDVELENPDVYVTYSVHGVFTVVLKKSIKEEQREKIAEKEIINANFQDLKNLKWNLLGVTESNENNKICIYTYKVEGYYETFVNTNGDAEKAKKLAGHSILNANFGPLKDIQWELTEIN